MNTFKKYLGYGMLAAAFLTVGTADGYAQASCDDVDGYTALDAKIRESYAKLATLPVAITSGKEFLEKYGTCEPTAGMATYLKENIQKWEARVKEAGEKAEVDAMFGRFDAAIKAGNAAQVYTSGREILAKQPGNPNVIMVMGAVGLDEAIKGNAVNVDASIANAKTALAYAKNPSSEFPKTRASDKAKTAGAFQYEFSREQAVDQMTYVIGYMHYYVKKDKKMALPYFYELSQSSERFKGDPSLYAAVGSYYTDEAVRLGNEIKPLIEKLNNAATTDEEKIELDKQIKVKEAVYKAYEERTLDAFGRAYKVAKNGTPEEKTYRDNLYKTIQAIYESRFAKKDGVDAWLSTATAKPMPNPLLEVTPIVEETTTTTTTTTSATPAGTNGKTATVAKP